MPTISAGSSQTFTAPTQGQYYIVSSNGGAIGIVSGAESFSIGPGQMRRSIGPLSAGQSITVSMQNGECSVEYSDDSPEGSQYLTGGQALTLNQSTQVDRPIVKYGTWTGNASPRLIEIGFEPDLVFVKGAGQYSVMYARPYWYGNIQAFGNVALSGSDAVPGPAIQPTGLGVVAGQAAVNSNGVVYHYVAIKDNGAGILRTWAYNGFRDKTVGAPDNQGTVSNPVTMDLIAGTNPAIIHIKRDAAFTGREGVWATTAFAKKESAAAPSGSLVSLAADGTMSLQTDPATNENDGAIVGEAHNGFSLHSPGAYWNLIQYTGTGGSQIIPAGGSVAFAVVVPQAAVAMEFWMPTMGTSSADGGNTALNSGRLSCSDASVTVSGVMNTAGVTYTLMVMYASAGQEKPRIRPRRPGVKLVLTGSQRIACGTDASLSLAGAHSLEWIGQISDSSVEQFIMGRGGNATTGSRGTPAAGSWNYGMAYTRDPDAGLEICTSDRFSSETTDVSKQQRWRTGVILRPFEDYHILYTHDGVDKWILYVNGVPVKWRRLPMSVYGLPGITATAGLTMSFGGRIASGTWAAAGRTLHRFGRIYNRVITATEVAQLYARHFAGATLNDISDSATALVEEWRFDDSQSTTVAATKNVANNGAITNGVWVF